MPSIYRLTMNGRIDNSIPFVTTHYFHAPSANVAQNNENAAELLDQLEDVILQGNPIPDSNFFRTVMGMSSSSAVMTSVQASSLYNDFDFAERGVNYVGLRNETPEGTGACYLFSSNRVRKDIGRGKRYIAGVTASAYASNTLTETYRTYAFAVALALSYTFTVDFPQGGTGTIVPVVLGSKYIDGTTNPREYEPYPDYAQQSANMYTSIFDANGSYPKLGYLRGRAR